YRHTRIDIELAPIFIFRTLDPVRIQPVQRIKSRAKAWIDLGKHDCLCTLMRNEVDGFAWMFVVVPDIEEEQTVRWHTAARRQGGMDVDGEIAGSRQGERDARERRLSQQGKKDNQGC